MKEEDTMKENTIENAANATFMVQIQCRQNATWQGNVTWVEGGEKKPFRSALELLKLVDSALDDSGMESDY